MSTYREAILHARSGGTAYCGGRAIRFLTREEAEPRILERIPSRRTVVDEKTGKPLVKDGKIVVETYADPHYRLEAFGLYDVGSGTPVEFRPTNEDISGTWSTEANQEPEPETVSPEVVDDVLTETLGTLDTEPPP